ncbi:hypothetical protein PRUPE_7G145500 [Prunus persica]|uniref:Uncharacterized protein n=1 Tax=Prunus persica TaxID=3760 RepID=M5VV55_PRUPE|nr:hypothetical protein PRUPE_7G145500 [Prunus persica]
MCFRVDCKQCGKYSWGGCGKHLATLYASIDEGKHCMCRSWPGVAIPKQGTPTPQQSVASASELIVFNILNEYECMGSNVRQNASKSLSLRRRKVATLRCVQCWPAVAALLD